MQRFLVQDLSDTIVLAGPNGVGKTRLIQRFLQYFQNPSPQPNLSMVLQATCKEESEKWGKGTLDTSGQKDALLLTQTLQANRQRRNWRSSVMYFESNRTIQKVKSYAFTWDIKDPDEEVAAWNITFGGLQNRWQDTLHSIFRKVQHHVDRLGRRAIKLDSEGKTSMSLGLNDPLDPFRVAFRQLLAPKELTEVDIRHQTLSYRVGDSKLDINRLSSGEQEVVNIIFDFILRKPSNSIIVFDEPELHLHPELSHKLIQTLRRTGENNQFIFCTHSPDIITASLDSSVIFLAPSKKAHVNQAIPVAEDDETNQALRRLGQSVGIIALGKKIVLIEGGHNSLDKQLYGAILEDQFPNLVLVPSSGKTQITSFSTILDGVLRRSIWGVDFFMVCDGDAIAPKDREAVEAKADRRLRVLDRYHIENFFLDEPILAQVFEDQVEDTHWLRDPEQIRLKLIELARPMVPYTLALYTAAHFRERVGNIDMMPKGVDKSSLDELLDLLKRKAREESARVVEAVEGARIDEFVADLTSKLEESFRKSDDYWKKAIPGKTLLSKFAHAADIPADRLKMSYIKHASGGKESPFRNIIEIFDGFSQYSSDPPEPLLPPN